MKKLYTAHKKLILDIKNYGKTNQKYLILKQKASRGTLEKIRKLTDEEFDALNPNEKQATLMEIQDIISDFEEPKDTNIWKNRV